MEKMVVLSRMGGSFGLRKQERGSPCQNGPKNPPVRRIKKVFINSEEEIKANSDLDPGVEGVKPVSSPFQKKRSVGGNRRRPELLEVRRSVWLLEGGEKRISTEGILLTSKLACELK